MYVKRKNNNKCEIFRFSLYGIFFLGHARNTSPQRCPGRLPSQMSKPPQLGVFDMEE